MRAFTCQKVEAQPDIQALYGLMMSQWSAAVRLTGGVSSPNDVHERNSKGHGGQLVSFLLDLLLESLLVALQKGLHAPLQDLLQDFHPFLRTHARGHISSWPDKNGG